MTRERAVPCRGATLQESIRGTHKTWADDGYCDRCRVLNAQVRLAAVSPRTAVSDRVTATRSARGRDTGSSSALLPLPRASSSSRYATGLDAPAAEPLSTSQVER